MLLHVAYSAVSKVGFIFHKIIAKLLLAVIHSVASCLLNFVGVMPKSDVVATKNIFSQFDFF